MTVFSLSKYLMMQIFLKIYFSCEPFLKIIFIYLILLVLGLCCCAGFSLIAESGGYSLLPCAGFSLWWLLLWSPGSSAHGCQQLQYVGSVVAAQPSRCDFWVLEHSLSGCGSSGIVAPQHVGSSWTSDGTCVSYIGRLILYL